jgi:hypothetical protein
LSGGPARSSVVACSRADGPAAVHSSRIECALIIPMIIQTILLYPSGAIWTDASPNVSRQHPASAVQSDAEHLTRNRKVESSNPSLTPHLNLTSPQPPAPHEPPLAWRVDAPGLPRRSWRTHPSDSSASLLVVSSVPVGTSNAQFVAAPAGHRMLASGRVACRSNESWAGGADLPELSAQ